MAAPSAPTAAASVGVATPNMMAPSTARISSASGKNDFSSITTTWANGTLPWSLGSGGARSGFMIASTIT